jgi:threonylcarbamoyladenosine tRNA methylthiotransferase MtaB
MKISVLTLGCRVNQSESSVIEGSLIKAGHSIVNLSDSPDCCVINTCTVTEKSNYQSRQLIRRALKTGARVMVTGCYAQISPLEIFKIDKNIELFNNDIKYNIINMLTDNIECYTYNYTTNSRPYLKIQDGCNLSCSYCIVPLARGKSSSLPVDHIIRRAREIEDNGYHEIVLTGIHLGTYGYDLKPKSKLSQLLKTILNNTSKCRLRLSSIEVKEIDTELIDVLQHDRICRHLHIPLQSGDADILKKMKRTYSIRYYLSSICNILKTLPDIAIGTDVIAGFPGEGFSEFLNTKKLLMDIPYSYIHIFPFSCRPHTEASKMSGQVSPQVKRERVRELKVVDDQKRADYISSQINTKHNIILEQKKGNSYWLGTSDNYLKVGMIVSNQQPGSLVRVVIKGKENNLAIGTPIDF